MSFTPNLPNFGLYQLRLLELIVSFNRDTNMCLSAFLEYFADTLLWKQVYSVVWQMLENFVVRQLKTKYVFMEIIFVSQLENWVKK